MEKENVTWIDIQFKIETDIINANADEIYRMPTIKEVAVIYECSDSTAKKVYKNLVDKGILIAEHGIGYFTHEDSRKMLLKKHIKIIEEQFAKIIKCSREHNFDKAAIEQQFKKVINELM